ncbi:radical SAM protein [Thermincola potens]|uniref:Radical SAM domain protein n=1 Tax=Thermincola potens (strain JR) TaxID=635013 RepID=D5XAD5_THEPJ|nr:radical SAM protein [Thermincola potens]ADG81234.1 Radical SAM domain protein [Thermincola potens JR]
MNLSRVLYLARYYIRAKFFNDKRPILSGMKLTHRCTLTCRQCPYWQRPAPDLSWQKAGELFPFLYKKGIRLLIFEGGEPLLWKDGSKTIHDLVREAKRYFFCVGVTTNGTLPLDVDTDIIWVSIDGLRKTHDALRGKSFDRIIDNIKSSCHAKIFANITINRINAGELPELVRVLAPLVKGITIQFFYPYPESEDLALSWEQRSAVLDQLIKMKKEGYPLTDSVLALQALKDNNWKCEPWMIANVEPDGTFNQGCYLKNRTGDEYPCTLCGFAAHTEISLAYQLHWSAIMAGKEILGIF